MNQVQANFKVQALVQAQAHQKAQSREVWWRRFNMA